jgi:hypothetical protein
LLNTEARSHRTLVLPTLLGEMSAQTTSDDSVKCHFCGGSPVVSRVGTDLADLESAEIVL